MLLKGKNIVIGVTGGIAVYKACLVVRNFKKLGANVDVIMTQNATEFVTPLTFETLSCNPVAVDMFHRSARYDVEHVSLAKKADLMLVCPATANILGKMACGIADDMLSTTLMATNAPVVVCPAMNVNMYRSKAVQHNLGVLRERGVLVVDSASGFLACGDNGEGRLADTEEITDFCVNVLCPKRDLAGRKVLVTCGGTTEKLDDCRCLTNFSSGKMGSAVVTCALNRGAEVTVVLANHTAVIDSRANVVNVTTTQEMYSAVLGRVDSHDIFVMAGAPCDYRPEHVAQSKIKGDKLTLNFVKNPDIAQAVGKVKGDKFLCVFCAETDNGVSNAQAKLSSKGADLAVLNDVKSNNVFNSDTNVVSFVTADGVTSYPEMSKLEVADLILDRTVQ